MILLIHYRYPYISCTELEQFVYGKSGKNNLSNWSHSTERAHNMVDRFNHSTKSSKSIVVRKKKKDVEK